MLYLYFLIFKEKFNKETLYKLFWNCFEKCTDKLRVPINTFEYTDKKDKLTLKTPVYGEGSQIFMMSS